MDGTVTSNSSQSPREQFLEQNSEKKNDEQNDILSIENLPCALGVLIIMYVIVISLIKYFNNIQDSGSGQRGNRTPQVHLGGNSNSGNVNDTDSHGVEKEVSSSDLGKKQEDRTSQNVKPKPIPIKEPKIHKEPVRIYQYLTVYNRKLEIADEYQTLYYRMWHEDGKIFFDFDNNERTPMAINNRSFIIEPFCDIDESSRTPDESKRIETKEPGLLNMDLSLNKKAVIKYL